MKIKQKYDENSIESISPRDFTRLRPGVYAGSTEYSTQLVKEIFSNALDEHIAGRCSTITISINTKENSYSLSDDGQGFPINVIREDGETVLQAAFDVMNTSGKYRNGTEDSCYFGSLGTNGCGSKLTNFLSIQLDVLTYNASGYEHIWFKDGIFENREVGRWPEKTTGTTVKWIPDPQFFQNKEANIPDLKKLFEDISALCPALTIIFIVDDKETIFHAEKGIQDLVNKYVKDKEIISNRFYIRKEANTELFDIALTYTSDYNETMIAYANYGLTEGGVHISTVKAAVTYQINKYAKENNLLKKNDSAITQSELSEGLFIIFNIKTTNIKYDSQTKTRITDISKTLMNTVLANDFYTWLINNPKDAKAIIDKALLARKAREAAQNAKERIRGASTKGKKFISLPTKLVDAYSKNRAECEIFIVEGDSAANGLVAKRDGKTQAVFPIRGKILNCMKATPDKVYANQEVANIVKAIGLDIDKSSGKLIYDIKKLRYNKIVIATDADEDGYQIRMLIINMLWWLCPDLITNGHLCVAIPPLYRITNKKNEYIFLKDEKELNDYKKKHKNESFIIGRNKGLGESSPDELAYGLLRPETRIVKQLVVKDFNDCNNLLEIFMGNKVEPRREFLLDHISEVED